ncbi:hypothetical protein, partial [Sphaerisporangium rhizosphaerae]
MSRHRSFLGAIAVAALLVLATGRAALSEGLDGATKAAGASVAAATAGCGKAPTLTSGTRSITTSGKNRSYIL